MEPPQAPLPTPSTTPGSRAALPVAVMLFTGAYLLAALVVALRSGNPEFVFYIVTMFAIIAGIGLVHRRVGLHPISLWCLSAWGAVHMAGGLVRLPAGWPYEGDSAVLYSLWLIPERLKYDQVVHAFGFGVAAWVCWQGLAAATGRRRPTAGLLLLSGLAAMGLGAFNEVIEFVATRVMPSTNVGGYVNTGWDLVANLTGVVVAVIWLWVGTRRT